MIKIVVDKDNIKISGHAGYGVKGSDIVCASVSSIVITSLNAIISIDENAISYKQDEGFIEVDIKKHEKTVDILIDNMISMLEELEKEYKKNIKIDRR